MGTRASSLQAAVAIAADSLAVFTTHRMFGLFKKRAATPPRIPPPLPPNQSAPSEQFWEEPGMAPLVPAYIQLHLASRSPQHSLARKADGAVDTDEAPGLMVFMDEDPRRQERIRKGFVRLMTERLPNNPAILTSLSREEIVSRLGNIYTELTAKDMYAIVCKKWCSEHKLVSELPRNP